MFSRRPLMFVATLVFLAGCMPSLDEQVKKSPNSIIGKKTRDITKYDEKEGRQLASLDVNVSANPVTYPLEAYGPMVGQIVQISINPMIETFNIENNRYPTYDEFMSMCKQYNVELPVLPAKRKYQYDEAHHRLVIVEPLPTDSETPPADQPAPPGGTTSAPATPAPGGLPIKLPVPPTPPTETP